MQEIRCIPEDWLSPTKPTRTDCQGDDKSWQTTSWLQLPLDDVRVFVFSQDSASYASMLLSASLIKVYIVTSSYSRHKINIQTSTEKIVTVAPPEFAYKENKCYRTGKLH